MKFRLVLLAALCVGVGNGVASAGETDLPVDLFAAMDRGEIDVKFIPKNEKHANVLITNKTKEVLQIRLPNSFAASPILAQLGPLAGGPGGGGAGGGQSVGGGMNAGGGAQPGGIGLGGFMRVAPQKTRKLTAVTVCLEHGKPNPNPKMAYKIMPTTQYTQDERMVRMCEQLAAGEVNQKVAQAAAWHLANNLSWTKLRQVNQLQSRYLGNVPFFSRSDLERAKELIPRLGPANKTPSKSYVATQ